MDFWKAQLLGLKKSGQYDINTFLTAMAELSMDEETFDSGLFIQKTKRKLLLLKSLLNFWNVGLYLYLTNQNPRVCLIVVIIGDPCEKPHYILKDTLVVLNAMDHINFTNVQIFSLCQ